MHSINWPLVWYVNWFVYSGSRKAIWSKLIENIYFDICSSVPCSYTAKGENTNENDLPSADRKGLHVYFAVTIDTMEFQ